jgi:ABC-2 type transport system ATP-binding protein
METHHMTRNSASLVGSPPAESEAEVEPAISVSGLRKHYGSVKAVDGVDLEIARGEVVALLGPNGAGKSTTIDMLLGLTRPDDGQVRLFGRTPEQAVRDSLVGATLQEGGLIDDATVREIVTLVASLHRDPLTVSEALGRAGIEDLAGRRPGSLSGGQKQRLRFALALVGDPELLVLDEPTAAMDVASRRDFWDSMRRFTDAGRTVLFATHYLDEAQEFADRVVLMRAGKVIADGTVAEIRAKVSGRVLSAEVPGVTLDELLDLPGVVSGTMRGDHVKLQCSDSEATLRAILSKYPQSHDIEVNATGLEEAFLALTSDTEE